MRTLLIITIALSAIAHADWPKWRGPAGDGTWECAGLPLAIDEPERVWGNPGTFFKIHISSNGIEHRQ